MNESSLFFFLLIESKESRSKASTKKTNCYERRIVTRSCSVVTHHKSMFVWRFNWSLFLSINCWFTLQNECIEYRPAPEILQTYTTFKLQVKCLDMKFVSRSFFCLSDAVQWKRFSLRFEPEIEPMFCTMALFDYKERKKVCLKRSQTSINTNFLLRSDFGKFSFRFQLRFDETNDSNASVGRWFNLESLSDISNIFSVSWHLSRHSS